MMESTQVTQLTIDGPALACIRSALHKHTGIDFAGYKESSTSRRVQRRMVELDLQDVRAYAERVAGDADEAHALSRRILVSVTRFFRDAGAFNALAGSALPRLMQRARVAQLRVWVAGCATGEEAYSVAMVLQEALDALPDHLDFRLFATDVDAAAVERASAGVFELPLLSQLPEPLRARYFTRRGDRCVVDDGLREKLRFSQHDLTQDPPFSHLDLVCCRNVLIYLKPDTQLRVLGTLSAALHDDGVLWLGASESLGARSDHFKALDTRWRMFAARANRRREPVLFGTGLPPQPAQSARRMKKDDLSQLLQAIHRVYVPPCLVIDSHYRLLYRFGDLDALLRLPTGAVTLDIRDLLPEELGTLVTAMLSKAQTGSDLVHRSLSATTDQGTRRFDLRACPLTLPGHGELVALFFEALASEHRPHQALQSNALENELRQTRESLQATIEELEASNEEMHATNEELIAANEELQSTNEELQTVNDQLHVESAQTGDKLNELCDANGDMERLLAHLDVGLVVLDDQLVIRRFNPTATSHFNLLPQDVGRSLTQLSHRLRFDDLVTACQRALLEPPSPGWQTVQTDDGRALQLQLRSYEAQHTPLTTQSGRSLVIAIVAPPNP